MNGMRKTTIAAAAAMAMLAQGAAAGTSRSSSSRSVSRPSVSTFRSAPARSYTAPARSTYVAPSRPAYVPTKPAPHASATPSRKAAISRVPARGLVAAGVAAPVAATALSRGETYRMVCQGPRGQYAVEYDGRSRRLVTRTGRDTTRLEIVGVARMAGGPTVMGRDPEGARLSAQFGNPRSAIYRLSGRERRDDCR